MLNDEFIELKNSNKIPGDCKLIKDSVVSQRCVKLSVALESETLDDKSVVVPDKVVWAAYSKNNGVYSSDGNFIYNYHLGTFIKYLTRDRLVPINKQDFKNKIQKWRNKKMENIELSEKLQNLNNKIGNKAGAPAVPGVEVKESTAFKNKDAELAKLEAQAKKQDLQKAISAATAGVELADTKELKAYNEARAEFIGWITDRDVQIRSKVDTKVVKDLTTKKPVLVDNAPQSIISDLARGAKIPSEYLKKNSTLKIVQNAPGPVRFGAIKLPVTGLVSLDKLRDPSQKLTVDSKAPTDYVTKFYSKKELAMTVVALIGEEVKESPLTHKDPSRLVVKLVGKPVTDKTTSRVENRLTPVISVENKRSLLTATNYFPRTTFKTIDIGSIKTQEDINKANLSLFGNLFRSVANRDISFNKLDAQEKEKVAKEGNTITSKFFDPAVRMPLGVKGVFTNTNLANPGIVEKIEQPTKDGKSTTLKAISFNSAGSEEDTYGISPFTDPRFEGFLKACDGHLTRDVMKNLYKKSSGNGGSTSNRVELSATEATKMFLANAMGNGTTAISFKDGLDKDALERIDNDFLRTLNEYGARS